nr:MAG TPA: hypothetical protein [Caudoviricetes sp.]
MLHPPGTSWGWSNFAFKIENADAHITSAFSIPGRSSFQSTPRPGRGRIGRQLNIFDLLHASLETYLL